MFLDFLEMKGLLPGRHLTPAQGRAAAASPGGRSTMALSWGEFLITLHFPKGAAVNVCEALRATVTSSHTLVAYNGRGAFSALRAPRRPSLRALPMVLWPRLSTRADELHLQAVFFSLKKFF